MPDRPARPPVPLQYLLWDGTDPQDSHALGNELERTFRCVNLLNDSPATESGVSAASRGHPRTFEPCGPDGTNITNSLWRDGMFVTPLVFADPKHHNVGDDRPHILAYSGHGIPGYMFSESSVLVCASRPLGFHTTTWDPSRSRSFFAITPQWNNPATKVALFSACRQLAGRPQQFFWSRWMRGASPVHTILSYHRTAPAAGTSARINRSFVANLHRGQPFVRAWRNAHGGSLRRRWAALCYRSAVGDRLDEWVRRGSLASSPAADEDILYFDETHRAGRVVTEPSQVLDCSLTFRSSTLGTLTSLSAGDAILPWYPLRKDMKLNLHVKFLNPSESFRTGDVVWIAALQVRPDYAGPFDIEQLIKIDGYSSLVASGDILPAGRIHDESVGWVPDDYWDLYEFRINRAGMSWLTHDAHWNELTIPITIGGAINNHVPIYYFMLRVKRGTTEIGIPTTTSASGGITVADQTRLIDDFQFSVFALFDSA